MSEKICAVCKKPALHAPGIGYFCPSFECPNTDGPMLDAPAQHETLPTVCALCEDGYPKITTSEGEVVHEALGVTWICTGIAFRPPLKIAVSERWFNTERGLPPDDVVVDAMNSDGAVVQLYRRGRLWFVPDGSSYVYYIPVFWKPLTYEKSGSRD